MPDEAAHKLQETVDEIVGYSRRTRVLVERIRRLARWQIVLTVACLLVAAGAGYLYVRLHDDQVGNCQAANQSRMQQEKLWDTFLTLAAGPHPTPVVRAAELKLLNQGKETYVQVDCNARYPFW